MENSKKIKRINKIKMFTLWAICALVALFFKFSMVVPTYAYTLNSDGNLVSENLFSLDNFHTNGAINYSFEGNGFRVYGASSINWNRYVYKTMQLLSGTYTLSYDQNPLTTIYIFDGNTQIFGDGQTQLSHMNITFTLQSNTTLYFRWYTNSTISNIMLNSGSSAEPYEPYGTWIAQNNIDYNNALLANMGMMQYLGYMNVINDDTNQDIEIDGYTEFTKEYLIDNQLISSSGVLNLNYFNTTTLNPNYNAYRVIFYFDTNISLNLFTMSFVGYSNGTITLRGDSNYIIQIDSNSNTYTYDSNSIVDSSLTYINEIVVKFDSADALSNINFNSYSIVNYNNGYNYGYTIGNNKGYEEGYSNGDSVGYQRGLNDGVEQDISNSGFRTLITTILSYPVNMIRQSLNFEFMGVHIASVVLFIISLGIVAFVIKRFKD